MTTPIPKRHEHRDYELEARSLAERRRRAAETQGDYRVVMR